MIAIISAISVITVITVISSSALKRKNTSLNSYKKLNKELENRIKEQTDKLNESEKLFKTMSDSSPTGIVIYQEKMRYANQFILNLFEYSEEEFYELHPEDLIADLEEKELVKSKTKEKIGGKAFDGTYVFHILTKSGKQYITNVYTTTITFKGKIAGLAVFIDDTERKNLADRLQKSENLFRTLSENMDTGLVLYREKPIYANPAALKITHYDQEDFYKKYVWDLFTTENSDTIKTKVKERIDGNVFGTVFTMKCVGGDGKIRSLLLKNSTVKYDEEWCGISSFIDISELENLKSDFVSVVSHELRTPLTSIIGFTKLIEMKFKEKLLPFLDGEHPEIIDDKIKNIIGDSLFYINIMLTEGDRLGSLINDILDINKIESGKVEYKNKFFNIREAIDQSISSVYSLIDNEKIKLSVETDENIPEIFADKDKIIQVIINLLSNAIKFTDKGYIVIKTSRESEFIKMSVSDSGHGIDPKDLSIIFDKFSQGKHDILSGKPIGSGLGLAISKSIVEHYGGKIWADSTPGSGSTFSITIPIVKN